MLVTARKGGFKIPDGEVRRGEWRDDVGGKVGGKGGSDGGGGGLDCSSFCEDGGNGERG